MVAKKKLTKLVSKRKKGSQMEKLCLAEFKEYMAEERPDHKLVDEWISVPTKFQNQDLFGSFDIALAYRHGTMIDFWLIQVRSTFQRKYYNELRDKWKDVNAFSYLAIYSETWGAKDFSDVLKLKTFKLVRI